MHLCDIFLRDFRNYRELNLEFDQGVNLIVGENAQGKTNLLEAISYLGSGKSFRAQKTGEMIRFGAEYAELEGSLDSQERQQSLKWVLFSGARPRQLYRNGVKKKTTAEIAAIIGIKENTMKYHNKNIYSKLGVSSRKQFLRLAALKQIQDKKGTLQP